MIGPDDVRLLGGLPEEIADERLRPHLESAERLVWQVSGYTAADPATLDEAVLSRLREAAGCFAISYALPVLNTFFLANA